MSKLKSKVRDGIRIDWDVPIEMTDGLVLRCDVFRRARDGQYPAILTYGPYGKYRAFQDGYPVQWNRMAQNNPDVTLHFDRDKQPYVLVPVIPSYPEQD